MYSSVLTAHSGAPRRYLPEAARSVVVQYTGLIADGSLMRLYVETSMADITKFDGKDMHVEHFPSSYRGRGTGLLKTVKYFNYMTQERQLIDGDHSTASNMLRIAAPHPDAVLLDNERALNVIDAREVLTEMGVTVHNYPAYCAHLMDPCDNSFHGVEQKHLDNLFATVQRSKRLSGDETMEMIREAYTSVSADSVVSFFKRCGFIDTGRSPREVMSRLFDDHRRSAKRLYRSYHEDALRSYLSFVVGRGGVPQDEAERVGPWWELIRHYRRLARIKQSLL